MSQTRMPALFLGHGSPMNVLEENSYTNTWRKLGETLPRPKAIIAVSAHWYTKGTAVTAMENPCTIHDFGGSRRRYLIPTILLPARLHWRAKWQKSCLLSAFIWISNGDSITVRGAF